MEGSCMWKGVVLSTNEIQLNIKIFLIEDWRLVTSVTG